MKAARFSQYGSPDTLTIADVETPSPLDHEVLIKIAATSINSWDWELLRGVPFANRMMFGLFKPKKIIALGCDVAGTVAAIGKDVTRFEVGDEVFGDLSEGKWGGFAEYTCADEQALSLKPINISFIQAAAIPQAALLAYQGIVLKGQVQAGQKVLINGGGGGAGTFAIQIARSLGAVVTAVDSTEKLDAMRSLGADVVMDYTKEDFTDNDNQYDLIFDCMLIRSVFVCKTSLKPKGTYVVVGGDMGRILQTALLGPFISWFEGKHMGLLLHKANKGLDDMMKLIEFGKVTPVIDRSFPLDETVEAFQYFDQGHAKGKVVVTMEASS